MASFPGVLIIPSNGFDSCDDTLNSHIRLPLGDRYREYVHDNLPKCMIQ